MEETLQAVLVCLFIDVSITVLALTLDLHFSIPSASLDLKYSQLS